MFPPSLQVPHISIPTYGTMANPSVPLQSQLTQISSTSPLLVIPTFLHMNYMI